MSSSESNIVQLRPGGLSAREMEAVETIALMLLQVDGVRPRLAITAKPMGDLVADYGAPELISQAFCFPVMRWARDGEQWLAIDQGRIRVEVTAGRRKSNDSGALFA